MKTFLQLKNLAIICFMVMIFTNTRATTFTVTNTSDNTSSGSLRWAITQANANFLGPNTIVFNIPTSDPNFNTTTGIYTITAGSLLPAVASLNLTIDGTTQPGNIHPNICINSTSNLAYGICFPTSGGVLKSFIINGFQMGVLITKYLTYPSGSCVVSGCYVGVNYNGTVAVPNNIGIACYGGVASDTIKNNLISGNITAGIGIRNSNNNIIKGNKIGTNLTGLSRIPNYYGVAIDSSTSNMVGGLLAVERNIISGNIYAGVAINSNVSHDNVIRGNYIGTNINALVRSDTISNYFGIAIDDSYNNTIGGVTAPERNIISGNSYGGISILGTSAINTVIKGNYIGTNKNGNDSIPNGNGILMDGPSGTAIGGAIAGERNIISGNKGAGIAMAYTGTRNNTIKGNYIGVDVLGTHILSNDAGIYLKSNANSNIIGGSTAGERNIISGNFEMGLCIESSDSNTIKGNFIGPDVTGVHALKLGNDSLVQGNGLMFNSNSKYNTAGGYNPGDRNVISGNRIYGHDLYGNSSYNYTIGNYIGVDSTGNVPMPNATGICVDGGSNHNPFINNVLSGNRAYGVFFVTTGTNYNELRGNIIGTNAAGTDTVPNQIGVILGGGTKYNIIGGTTVAARNIISGNRFEGVLAADSGTRYNDIKGNYIGTDITGSLLLPNYIGVGLATNPANNNIESNVISGNKYIGLILYENCNNNTIYSNCIGVAANGITPINNGGAGIIVAKGSQHNKIGAVGKGNIIAYNDSAGVAVIDNNTLYNTISANMIYANTIMDIDLYPFGVTPNDPGDGDTGANELMNFPVITNAFLDYIAGTTTISGTMDHTNPVGITVELFKSDTLNMFGYGGATAYLGSTVISAPNGDWTFNCNCLAAGDAITATATDTAGNTSEFAANFDLIVGVKENTPLNDGYAVYPNPANDRLTVSFGITKEQETKILLYSITGTQLAILDDKNLSGGNYVFNYDLSQYDLAPGIYYFAISADNIIVKTKKVAISK